MIFGNILWKQHELSKFFEKYWQIIPSRTVTLYISEIEISLLTKIFLNLSIILKMNVVRYLTLLVYKGSVDCQCEKATIWWVSLLWELSWAWACWACFVEISYSEADNGDLVLVWGQGFFHEPERSSIMVTDTLTKMKIEDCGWVSHKLQSWWVPFSFDWTGAWQLIMFMSGQVASKVSSDELLKYEDDLSFRVRLLPSYLTSFRWL